MNTRGNAFVYILIAIALFGSLTFALSGSQETASVSELDEGRATIAANEILSYTAAAQNSIAAMNRMGTGTDQLDFVLPSDTAAFNAAPHINKLFHPEGGGLTYKALPRDAIVADVVNPEPGYYINLLSANTEWTPTDTGDVIFTAWGINRPVCEELNYKITGSRNIYQVFDSRALLIDISHHAVPNEDFEVSDCSDCDGKPAFCVEDPGGEFVFYNILVAR